MKLYQGSKKHSPLYTSWRAFKFTKKGVKAGWSDEWDIFANFYLDMESTYEKWLYLGRFDKNKPFSKENCKWMTMSEIMLLKDGAVKLSYNGEEKNLYEWAVHLGIPYSPLRQRYHKGKNYTAEEILFGIKHLPKRELLNEGDLNKSEKRSRASKMVSSYRCKDKKRGYVTDIDMEWFMQNISNKPCYYCGKIGDIGCDRVDNKKGHTKDNVIPSCYICNVVRGDLFTVSEMKEISVVIKNILIKRKEGTIKFETIYNERLYNRQNNKFL